MTTEPKLIDFITRNARADFIRKAPNDKGGVDYFAGIFTADFLCRTFGLESSLASNEGRSNPLDLSLFNRQLVMEGEHGLIQALGGKKAAAEILELVEKPMKPEPMSQLLAMQAEAEGHLARERAKRNVDDKTRGRH